VFAETPGPVASAAPTPRPWHRGYLIDALLLLILAGLGAKIGADYAAADFSPTKPTVGQTVFAPAVLETCGRGFVNSQHVPALAQFLTMRRTTFDCRELPQTIERQPPDAFQASARYMMLVVEWYWKATGISWHLAPIFGAMHAVVVGLGYLTFRAVMARLLAALLTLAIAFSPAQLSMLPYLRDSSKAPCFMALALILVLVWTRPLTTRTIVLLCGAFGLITGIGLGFRPDLLLCIPVLAIALFCASHTSVRRRVVATMLGLSVAAGALVVSGWPILAHYRSGSSFGHVAILGFSKPFDGTLGVRGTPYTLGHYYDDFYVRAAINSYATRVYGYSGEIQLSTPVYERYATKYVWDIVRTFPADVGTRLVASVEKVLNLPFQPGEYESGATTARIPYLRAGVNLRDAILWRLNGWGPSLVLAVFALLAVRGYAFAAGFAMTVLFLAGLPVLQFQLRHYSHLEVLGLFALGVVIQTAADRIAGAPAALSAMKRQTRTRWEWAPLGREVLRVSVCVGVLVLVPLASLAALRSRQQATVARMIDAYNLAAAEPLSYSAQPEDSEHVLVRPLVVESRDRLPPQTKRALVGDYIVVDLSNACGALSLTMRLKYALGPGPSNLTRDAVVKLWPAREYGNVRLFVPVYQAIDAVPANEVRFVGLEFLANDLPCLAGLRRVPASDIAPLWLDLVLSRNWKDRLLYQTLERETVPADPDLTVYLAPPGIDLRVRGEHALSGVPRDMTSEAKVATVDFSTGVRVDGIAESPTAYLLGGKPRIVTAGTRLVGVGELFAGGFTFGLQSNGAWSRYANVTKPGPFVAAVEVPTDGTYVVVIANDNEGTPKPTRFVITGMDWIGR
jgi:hypothetical protein